MDINELAPNSKLSINVMINQSAGTFTGIKKQSLKSGMTTVHLKLPTNKVVSFKDSHIEVTYADDSQPVKWNNCQIRYIDNHYVLITPYSGVKINRRECARVDVAVNGTLKMQEGTNEITVKDISLSGFAITSRQPLDLKKDSIVYLTFEDSGYEFVLKGQLVRTVKQDFSTLYGFVIKNLPRNLSGYVSDKQRQNRRAQKQNA